MLVSMGRPIGARSLEVGKNPFPSNSLVAPTLEKLERFDLDLPDFDDLFDEIELSDRRLLCENIINTYY